MIFVGSHIIKYYWNRYIYMLLNIVKNDRKNEIRIMMDEENIFSKDWNKIG